MKEEKFKIGMGVGGVSVAEDSEWTEMARKLMETSEMTETNSREGGKKSDKNEMTVLSYSHDSEVTSIYCHLFFAR